MDDLSALREECERLRMLYAKATLYFKRKQIGLPILKDVETRFFGLRRAVMDRCGDVD